MLWFFNYLLRIALSLAAYRPIEMAKDFPIGIYLGPNHITSAYIKNTNEVVTVTSIEASQEWNTFFLDSLRTKRSRDEKKIHADEIEGEIANSTLSQIRLATEKKLGRSVEIHAIAYPQHFQNSPYIMPLYNTAIKSVPGFNDFMQMGPYLYYIRFAYGLNTSQALGYPPETKLSDYNALLLHIDYNKDFLEVSIMEAAEEYSVRDRVFRIDNFGGSDNIASPDDLAEFKVRFEKLLDEQIKDNQYCQTNPEDFRFIINTGEASSSEFQKVREAIVAVVPEFSNRFLDSIDPFWVGATGAANRAKECFLDPPDSGKAVSTSGTWGQLEQDWEDELRRREVVGSR